MAPRWGSEEWFRNKFTSQGADQPGAYFGHAATGYQRYRHARLIGYLRQVCPTGSWGRMLDIGCGTGELTALVARTFAFESVTGTDFVEPAIGLARRRFPGLAFEVAALPRLPFDDATFDLVIASEVLYYLDADSRSTAAQEITRVMRSGGVLLFSSALGEGYFTEESARALLGGRLRVGTVHYDYNRLFHKIMAPVELLNNVYHAAYSGTRGSSERANRLAERYQPVFQTRPVRAVLTGCWRATLPLQASIAFPAWAAATAERLFPRWARSNITVIALKP